MLHRVNILALTRFRCLPLYKFAPFFGFVFCTIALHDCFIGAVQVEDLSIAVKCIVYEIV